MRTLAPGQEAILAQHRAAQRTVEDAWPYNESLLADERVECAALDLLGQPDDERVVGVQIGGGPPAMGRGYLLWNGGAFELPPNADEMTVGALARVTAPALGLSTCDRCGGEGCSTAAVVVISPHVVGLTFCGTCAARLATTDQPVRWTSPTEPQEGKP